LYNVCRFEEAKVNLRKLKVIGNAM